MPPKFYFEDGPYESEDADGKRRRFDGRVRRAGQCGALNPRTGNSRHVH